MRLDTTSLNDLGVLGAILGQAETPATTPTGAVMSYQAVWDKLNETCAAMIGPEECVKLLGYGPFVCPPPTARKVTEQWWFWLAFGIGGGVIAGKFFQ